MLFKGCHNSKNSFNFEIPYKKQFLHQITFKTLCSIDGRLGNVGFIDGKLMSGFEPQCSVGSAVKGSFGCSLGDVTVVANVRGGNT